MSKKLSDNEKLKRKISRFFNKVEWHKINWGKFVQTYSYEGEDGHYHAKVLTIEISNVKDRLPAITRDMLGGESDDV